MSAIVADSLSEVCYYPNKGVLNFVGEGTPRTVCAVTPTQFCGAGKIYLSKGVTFGYVASPGNLSISYIDARTTDSVITFDENIIINNRASMVSAGASISIGRNCLIEPECHIYDSNGHEMAVSQRMFADRRPLPVRIGDDVFIGSRVTILKGVTVGNGCVIAAGAVLFPRFIAPPYSVIAGNPATVVRPISAGSLLDS